MQKIRKVIRITKNHHTRRLVGSRKKKLKIFIKGFSEGNGRHPTKEEINTWKIGFNTGYKEGRIHERNPIISESPYKKVLDELFMGKITFDEALRKTGLTTEKLHDKIDNYDYVPSLKEICRISKNIAEDTMELIERWHTEKEEKIQQLSIQDSKCPICKSGYEDNCHEEFKCGWRFEVCGFCGYVFNIE